MPRDVFKRLYDKIPLAREYATWTVGRSKVGSVIEHAYWLRREREELALAGCTTCMEAKFIHLELASRYSLKAYEEALGLRTARSQPLRRPTKLANVVQMFGTAPTLLTFAH